VILQTEIVEQVVEGEERARFIKEVIASREGRHPIAMVRKRLVGQTKTRGALLLIHGFGQNRYTWHTSRRSFVNHLAVAGFDVFNLELRGRGRSRKFGAREDTGLDDYIREDVPAALRTVVRISGHERPFLIGHSMGGLISYAVSGSSARGEIAGIITMGSPYRFGLGSLFLKVAAPLFYGARLTGAFDGDPAIPIRFIGKQLRLSRRLWDNPYLPMPMRIWSPGSMEPEVLEENLEAAFEHTTMGIALGIVGNGRESALKSHDGLLDYGLAFELSDLPLLVIAGTHDGLAPPASVRPACERSRSTDKTYREFPLGHIDLVLGRDAPFTVWPLVRTWLTARAEREAAGDAAAESA
jgi:polyhydroxyalkanoate synthase